MESIDAQKRFSLYLKQLVDDLIDIRTNYLLLKKILDDAPKRLEVYNIAPTVFHLMIRSMYFRNVVTICRFFDPDTKTLSLAKVLRFAHANADKIFIEKASEAKKELPKDLDFLASFQDLVPLLKHRDQRFAHLDKKFVDNKETFLKEYPLENKNFETCLDLLESLLNKYSVLATNSSYMMEILSYDGELDVMLDYLDKYKKLQIIRFFVR